VSKPLAQSRLALVASGGIYRAGQVAFHFKDDISYREIDTRAPDDELRVSHFAYDVRDARSDPNVVYPAGTLRRLVAEGRLGELARRAYTFMGGIYSSRRVRDVLAPALAKRLVKDEVDCVAQFETRLEERNLLTRGEIDRLRESYTQELGLASKRVLEEPAPTPESIWDYVFADRNYVGGET